MNAGIAAESIQGPQLVELADQQSNPQPGPPVLGGTLSVLKGVSVRLSVVVGEARMTVGDLMALREEQVLPLDRPVDEPVDVMLDDRVVARGRLVAVDDAFGIQITELNPAHPA
jgi:flagellar motor switch protein FliN/FliY